LKWLNTIVKGDCRELLKQLPDKSCDIFLDPPYNVGKDYGPWQDNLPEHEYYLFIETVLKECKRAGKVVTVYTPHKHQRVYWQILGSDFHQITLWHPAKNGFYSGFVNKTAVLLTNAQPDKRLQVDNIWKVELPGLGYYAKEEPNDHPGYTTEEVTGKVIQRLCNSDIICDPFMGSGTTALAAAKLGKKYIGFELNPAYIEIAENAYIEIAEKRLVKELGMFQQNLI
jgi:site-specific DNA-methyltransferase (adenine-specific)